jgi:hypothetical protein
MKVVILSKPILLSKTFWLNMVGLLILVVQYLSGVHYIPAGIAEAIIAIGNLILRVVTVQPVSLGLTPQHVELAVVKTEGAMLVTKPQGE